MRVRSHSERFHKAIERGDEKQLFCQRRRKVSTNPNPNYATAAVAKITGANGGWEAEKARWRFACGKKMGETLYFYEAKGGAEPNRSPRSTRGVVPSLFPQDTHTPSIDPLPQGMRRTAVQPLAGPQTTVGKWATELEMLLRFDETRESEHRPTEGLAAALGTRRVRRGKGQAC
jgi:hypothetical protein